MPKHYHKNPRAITAKQLTDLERWLDELGDLSGIVHDLNSDEIPAGNQRSKVFGIIKDEGAITLTEQLERPTRQGTVGRGYIEWHGERYGYRQVRWTAEQCERANLIANTAGGTFEWGELPKFDKGLLNEVGFNQDLLKRMGEDMGAMMKLLDDGKAEPPEDAGDEAQIDRAEELQEKWQVQTGSIYKAGEHFVICGDCREPETWARLLEAAGVEKVNGVFTSPPYAEQRKKQYGGVPTSEYVEWWEAVQANVRANLENDGSFFVNIKPHCEDGERVLYVFDLVLAMRRRWGWRFVDELCWRDTRDGVPGGWNNRFKDAFEPIYQFCVSVSIKFNPQNVKHASDAVFDYSSDNAKAQSGLLGADKAKGYRSGMARPSNVIAVPTESAGLGHTAPFPVALPAFFVKAYSDAGDVWLDPFCGSGTVLVSCQNEGRIGLGIEKLEKYVAVILERLSQLGLTPERVS